MIPPRPGPAARAFLRCLLFASLTDLLAFVVGCALFPLLVGPTQSVALALSPFVFMLAVGFLPAEPRLGGLGLLAFVLLFAAAGLVPTVVE